MGRFGTPALTAPSRPDPYTRAVPERTAAAATDAATRPLTRKLEGLGTTIFAEMSALATETGAVNLGQGFPDTDGPAEVLDAAIDAIRHGVNQYPPGPGQLDLRQAIAQHQRRFYGIDLDPATEVVVTAGATEALAGALLGMLDAGDEVVVFEPMYDSYQACIALAGARAVPVLLSPGADGRYTFDPDELAGAVSERTKVILVNTPHNPTGKVFTPDELETIAALARDRGLIVVTDEVYEHLCFDGRQHVAMATLPDMWERTLTISSGGKTFNTTGWKIGWMSGPEPLVTAAKTAKQFLTYVNGAPFQPAIATGLRLPDEYFSGAVATLQVARDHLVGGLRDAGFDAHPQEATYFTTVDIRGVDPSGDGMAFCRALPERCGVVAIPNEVFYARPEFGRHLVRFACCKRLEVIDAAVEGLVAGYGR